MAAYSENFLLREFAMRRSNNPRYSERAFARDVGLSPGFLKLYFQGKRSLSERRAKQIANSLGWTEHATKSFLESLRPAEERRRELPASEFLEVSDWYHFAIIELLKTPGKWTIERVAKALKLTRSEVQYATWALQAHKLIGERDGHLRPISEDYVVPAASSSAIRKFHRQVTERAIAAIGTQSPEVRDFRSLTLAFPKKRKAEASAWIKKTVAEFEKKFGRGERDSVYQLNIAFYQVFGEEK